MSSEVEKSETTEEETANELEEDPQTPAAQVEARRMECVRLAMKEELSQYEINKARAEDEENWMKIDEFFEKARVPFDRAFVLKTLESQNLTSSASLNATELRMLGGDEPRSTAIVPSSCSMDRWCIHAVLKNGSPPTNDDIISYKFFPSPINIMSPMRYLQFDATLTAEGVEVGYFLDESIHMAVLMRVPQLRADRAQMILRRLCWTAGMGQIGLASRKERTCVGCGITWNNKMKRCSRCQSVHYCSPACIRGDWPNHRPVCRQLTSSDLEQVD